MSEFIARVRDFVSSMQAIYGKSVPKTPSSVLETMLFGICLEDSAWGQVESSLNNLLVSFFDLSEIQISSAATLSQALSPLRDCEIKGVRMRALLRHVFETTYSYDFEKFRRQTPDAAQNSLIRIKELTPFVRDFTLHEVHQAHIVPLDQISLAAAKWVGLLPSSHSQDEASAFLKHSLPTSSISRFCYLLRCMATDPRFIERTSNQTAPTRERGQVAETIAALGLLPNGTSRRTVAQKIARVREKSSDRKLDRPIQILIDQLDSSGNAAIRAAEALAERSLRQGGDLAPAIDRLAAFVLNGQKNVRAAVAVALGNIGTKRSVEALVRAFEASSAKDLASSCKLGTYGAAPLSYWLAVGIGSCTTKLTAEALISLLTSPSVPDSAKPPVLLSLCRFDLNDLDVKRSTSFLELLERFASSNKRDLSEAAIKLLGLL